MTAVSAVLSLRTRVWRRGGLSLRLDERVLVTCFALIAALLVLSLWSLSAGDFPLALGDVMAALLGQGEGSSAFIVFGLRLPRLLTGILVGLALGASGAIFQSLARNALASPDVVGFTSGAALGAVATVVLLGASGTSVALGAVAGGLAAAALVMLLSFEGGALSPLRIVLVGIGVGLTAYAGVDFLLTRSNIFEAAAAQAWLTGSLNARVWDHVWTVGLGVALLLPPTLAAQGALSRLELGDDLAAGLGTNINRVRLGFAIAAVLLAALAVSAAGPIAFVALVANPVARRISRSASVVLFTSALVGAVVVVGADLIGRLLLAPTQLPVGVFTAVMGGPYLLWLLALQGRKGAL